jgi:hypothetical protein
MFYSTILNSRLPEGVYTEIALGPKSKSVIQYALRTPSESRLPVTLNNQQKGSAAMVTITGVRDGVGSEIDSISALNRTDNFNILLRGGELHEFEANRAAPGSLDPVLTLIRPIGAPIVNDDRAAGDLDSRILYTPPTTANHTLRVEGFANISTGSYEIVAREVPATTLTYSTLNVNSSATGDLYANGDQDYHRITLVAGRTYRFNLDGADFGSGALNDSFLELRNSTGRRILASDDDSGAGFNSQLTFTAPTTNTYFANARGFANTGTGGYRLSATQIA